MIYRFGEFELDPARVELRANGAPVAVEPQVFALLALLVEHRERLVGKDEIIARVWDGRFISDAAVASRVKSARQALGDDGRSQRFIRTIHGLGFRFVADVVEAEPGASVTVLANSPAITEPAHLEPEVRPTIAVLPFRLVGVAGPHSGIADALPQDLITELSRLRWLFVIARASSFRFRGAEANIERVRETLNVRYCLSGVVEVFNDALTVSVELSDTLDTGIVWSDRFRSDMSAVHEIRERIVRDVVAALELQIPLNEARRARLKAPEHLDSWAAYHLGLQHMYRFTKADNAAATELFKRATILEPGFSRAYAGLSFTHFQDAFLSYVDDVDGAAKLAQHYAEQCLERDPVDPFGNFTMGRAFWLKGDLEASLPWLDRANALNPNYAQARYARAFSYSLLGEAGESRANADAAMVLSPLDPLLYAMLGVRALSHIVEGDASRAAHWAERAAHSPGAHALVEMIAVACHALNGDDARAGAWAQSARTRFPEVRAADFQRAFPFRGPHAADQIAAALRRHGF